MNQITVHRSILIHFFFLSDFLCLSLFLMTEKKRDLPPRWSDDIWSTKSQRRVGMDVSPHIQL